MELSNQSIRLGVLSAVLGSVLTAGVAMVVSNRNSASANESKEAPAPVPTLVVKAPEVAVPGYLGPLYDAQGRIVALSVEQKAIANPAYSSPNRQAVAAPARQGRSTKKSVAIVAGSAGAGAAIGALAGGGKGAAIGAISGGTAGFVYDRVTAKPKN